MNFHYLKSVSALALAGMFAMNAHAETLSDEFKVDFTQMEEGYMLSSYWGGPNANMKVVATDEGNLLFLDGVTMVAATDDDGNELKDENGNTIQVPATNAAGLPSWSTMAKYPGLTLPSGFNFSNILMVEVEYKPTQDDNVPFAIQIQQTTEPLYADAEIVVNEWNTLVFEPSQMTKLGSEELYTGTPSSFDFCLGANGSTNYYVKSITFYLEKEVTQREKDEAALDKSTAACVEFNFDEWPISELSADNPAAADSPYLGSNGGGVNRSDMIIDVDPENAENHCAHIVYGGWTQIFITQPVVCPEGYTFDDLRLVEYDIYESDIPGHNTTDDGVHTGKNGAPILKLKESYAWGWTPNNDGSACGNAALPSVNEWNHVEFYPSAYEWKERDFEQNILDENGEPVLDDDGKNVTEPVHWDADQVRDEFGKLTSFAMSIGFFPCLNQCYVDNVKLWFQKGGEDTAVDSISAVKANDVIYNVYGQRVDENYRGIVIKNGKKYISK